MKCFYLLILWIAILTASCSKKTFIIGMSEESFLAQDHKVVEVSSTATETVFKKIDPQRGAFTIY